MLIGSQPGIEFCDQLHVRRRLHLEEEIWQGTSRGGKKAQQDRSTYTSAIDQDLAGHIAGLRKVCELVRRHNLEETRAIVISSTPHTTICSEALTRESKFR